MSQGLETPTPPLTAAERAALREGQHLAQEVEALARALGAWSDLSTPEMVRRLIQEASAAHYAYIGLSTRTASELLDALDAAEARVQAARDEGFEEAVKGLELYAETGTMGWAARLILRRIASVMRETAAQEGEAT